MNAKQTLNILKYMPFDKSIMLSAKHGVGKSSIVKQAAKDLNIQCIDIRLSQSDSTDIQGLPKVTDTETVFVKPWWWPKDPNSKGYLFFDEINRAAKDVLQAVFEICLDRRLGGDPLPVGWRVIAAINATDDYDVIELDPALHDRWFHVDFDPTHEEWMQWARSVGVHDSIIDFLSQNKEYMDPPIGNLEPGKIYPSRRSWKQFHDCCEALDLYSGKDESLLTQVAAGWLGTQVSIVYPKFLANEFARLRAEDVVYNFDAAASKIEAAVSNIELISALSNSVFKLIESVNVKDLKREHVVNIEKFITLLPKDVASSFFIKLLNNRGFRKVIDEWRQDPKMKSILGSIYNA